MCIVTHMPLNPLSPSLDSDLEFKVAGVGFGTARGKFNPLLHPRDSKGRFIETGGIVRAGLAGLGKVVRVKPDGKVEVEFADGAHRDYPHQQITMVQRPNGAKPTKSAAKVTGEDATRTAHPGRGDGITGADLNPDLSIPDADPNDEDDDNPDDDDPEPPPIVATKVDPNSLVMSRRVTKDGKAGFIEKDGKIVGAIVRHKDGGFQVLDHRGRPVARTSDWEKGRVTLARNIEKQNRDWNAHVKEHAAAPAPQAPTLPVAAPNAPEAPTPTPDAPNAPENAPETPDQVPNEPDQVDPAVKQEIADRVSKMSDDELNRASLDDGAGMGTARELAIAEKERRNQERAKAPLAGSATDRTDAKIKGWDKVTADLAAQRDRGRAKTAPWMTDFAQQLDDADDRFDPDSRDRLADLTTALRENRGQDALDAAADVDSSEAHGGRDTDTPTRKAIARVVARLGEEKRAQADRPTPDKKPPTPNVAPDEKPRPPETSPDTEKPDDEKAPTQASMTRATRNQHGLKHGDEAWVADHVGTVRKGKIRVENGTTSFHPHDERVEPHEIGKGQAKFRAQKVGATAGDAGESETVAARDLDKLSTPDLIAQYDLAISSYNGRYTNTSPRQKRIDDIVDKLSARADADDPDALKWYENDARGVDKSDEPAKTVDKTPNTREDAPHDEQRNVRGESEGVLPDVSAEPGSETGRSGEVLPEAGGGDSEGSARRGNDAGGTGSPNEDYLDRAGTLMTAKKQAEERALGEILFSQTPEPGTENMETPRGPLPGVATVA